eukprot:gene12940-27304_t
MFFGVFCIVLTTRAFAIGSKLHMIRNEIIRDNTTDRYIPESQELHIAVEEFISNRFNDFAPEEPIFVYRVIVSARAFGNTIGRYLQGLTCAMDAGVHFIGIRPNVNYPEDSYFNNLLMVYEHPHPFNVRNKSIEVIDNCGNFTYPWTRKDQPWFRHMHTVKLILSLALELHLKANYPHHHLTISASAFDYYHAPGRRNISAELVPLIPDAVIVVRCNEAIRHGYPGEMGFLNFNLYTRLIPASSTRIYILTEPKSYPSSAHPNSVQMCVRILDNLVSFLRENFRSATIAIQRGRQFDAMIQISRAKIVISPPSTFSFWAGLISEGTVFMPLTTMFMDGLPINIAKNWKWMSYPEYPNMSFFGHYNLKNKHHKNQILKELKTPL